MALTPLFNLLTPPEAEHLEALTREAREAPEHFVDLAVLDVPGQWAELTTWLHAGWGGLLRPEIVSVAVSRMAAEMPDEPSDWRLRVRSARWPHEECRNLSSWVSVEAQTDLLTSIECRAPIPAWPADAWTMLCILRDRLDDPHFAPTLGLCTPAYLACLQGRGNTEESLQDAIDAADASERLVSQLCAALGDTAAAFAPAVQAQVVGEAAAYLRRMPHPEDADAHAYAFLGEVAAGEDHLLSQMAQDDACAAIERAVRAVPVAQRRVLGARAIDASEGLEPLLRELVDDGQAVADVLVDGSTADGALQPLMRQLMRRAAHDWEVRTRGGSTHQPHP